MTGDAESAEAELLAQDILSRYREVYRASREAEPWLRYGRRTIAVSTIAQQFYCEKAVQYSIERPMAPTREMLSGLAGHEAVAGLGVDMTPEQAVVEAVAAREHPVCIYEFRIGWTHHGVTVLGFVDEAWFRAGGVELVAERKFSGSRAIHLPYHVQAGLYCLGLGEVGFDVSRTRYRITVFARECHNCRLLEAGQCPGTSIEGRSYACASGSFVSEEYPFAQDEAVARLDWALGFWTGDREAEPTPHRSRCRSCRYRAICDAASISAS
jgi:hypothetical protein